MNKKSLVNPLVLPVGQINPRTYSSYKEAALLITMHFLSLSFPFYLSHSLLLSLHHSLKYDLSSTEKIKENSNIDDIFSKIMQSYSIHSYYFLYFL